MNESIEWPWNRRLIDDPIDRRVWMDRLDRCRPVDEFEMRMNMFSRRISTVFNRSVILHFIKESSLNSSFNQKPVLLLIIKNRIFPLELLWKLFSLVFDKKVARISISLCFRKDLSIWTNGLINPYKYLYEKLFVTEIISLGKIFHDENCVKFL